jgi:hypothetical protein
VRLMHRPLCTERHKIKPGMRDANILKGRRRAVPP